MTIITQSQLTDWQQVLQKVARRVWNFICNERQLREWSWYFLHMALVPPFFVFRHHNEGPSGECMTLLQCWWANQGGGRPRLFWAIVELSCWTTFFLLALVSSEVFETWMRRRKKTKQTKSKITGLRRYRLKSCWDIVHTVLEAAHYSVIPVRLCSRVKIEENMPLGGIGCEQSFSSPLFFLSTIPSPPSPEAWGEKNMLFLVVPGWVGQVHKCGNMWLWQNEQRVHCRYARD